MPVETSLNIAALVSVGQHPVSGRSRRADQDARAVELGLALAGQSLSLVHVGDAGEPALRQYLGMGLHTMTVLQEAPEADAVQPLLQYFATHPADIVLAGVQAERGEASGLLPYLLAERLGWPLVPRVAQVRAIENGRAEVLQALPRGQRRAVTVPLPFIATVDSAAPGARQAAFGPGQRGLFDIQPGQAQPGAAQPGAAQPDAAQPDVARADWVETEARSRPKRLNVVKAKSAAERFKAATAKPQGQGGQVMKRESSREKAQAIFDLLVAEGVIRQ